MKKVRVCCDILKFGEYNIGRSGQVLTLPFYMAFLFTEY
jgi:hypothetical protein